MKVKLEVVALATFAICRSSGASRAGVNPGDTITKDQANKVADLVSPGNLILVKQGMTMKIVPTDRLEWPPPYRAATEKYSPQVQLTPDGSLKNYQAGLPFPLVDANDPQAALKVMWNFSYRPLYTDDAVSKNVEISSFKPGSSPADPVEHFTIGNVGFYNNTGRTEVAPIPTDPEATRAGIRYRFGAYPFTEPSEMRGFGFIRYRNIDPKDRRQHLDDESAHAAREPRVGQRTLGRDGHVRAGLDCRGGAATYASTLDPDSFFGFAAKIEDFNYKLLGEKPMLAVVNAANSPAKACPTDGGRTICPENWEMRRLYVIEADAKQTSMLGAQPVDSEAGFVHRLRRMVHHRVGPIRPRRQALENLATFNAYRDRPIPDATHRNLAVQANVPNRDGRRRRNDGLLDRSALARLRNRRTRKLVHQHGNRHRQLLQPNNDVQRRPLKLLVKSNVRPRRVRLHPRPLCAHRRVNYK